MDGTDRLSAGLVKALPPGSDSGIIAYPTDRFLDYDELERWVRARLPRSERFILVAQSFSGPVAYRIARRPPPNLALLVLVASFVEPPHPGLRWVQSWLPLRLLLRRALAGGVVTRLLLGKPAGPELLERFRRVLAGVPGEVLSRRLSAMAQLPPARESIRVPCVYIRPRDDNLVAPRNIDVIRRIAPDLRVYTVEGRHFVTETNPAACVDALREALKEFVEIAAGASAPSQ
ncbi:MAG TPA: alpha/beta hydrolase [Acidiferrobacterales bacterium]|jgi:pimeloyl-ACP methyl ester carboxylesterase